MKEFTNNGINGNEINLDDVLAMATQIAEQIAQQEEDNMKQIERIVKGVARKYASIYVNREDLEQELWLVVCQRAQEFGGFEKLDPKFVARCCYNKAVDIYRYNRRRRDSSAQLIEDMDTDDDDNAESHILYSTFDTGYDRVVIKEVIDLFPQGSRERKYVVTKLYMYGEISEDDGLPDELEMPAGSTEADVLKLLGYNSKYPASWGKLKYQIRDTIYRYLGIIPDEIQYNEDKLEEAVKSRIEAIFKSNRSGYIDVSKLLKDKVLTLMGADSEVIWRAISTSKVLLRGLTKNGKKFIMKNEERFLQNSAMNEDVIIR